MLKNSLSKKILCTVTVLIIVMSFLSLDASALTVTVTKNMSVTDYYTVTAPSSQINDIINSIVSGASKTKSYNDGNFTGTLNYSNYYIANQVLIYSYASIYQYQIALVYSGPVTGTVTIPDNISASKTDYYTFTAPSNQADSIISSIVGGAAKTKSYDDGHYAGTLNYSYYYIANQTLIYSYASIYQYQIGLVYTGTPSLYNPNGLY